MESLIENLPQELQQLSSRQRLSKGQILYQQGDPANSFYLVESGRVKLVSFIEQQMITHYYVEEGESFSETALYFETCSCTAIADIASTVIEIPKQAFLDALRQSPRLSELYLNHLTRTFRKVKNLLELRSIRSARERMLHYLVRRVEPGQTTIVLERPLKSLASELGLTPEVVSRILSQLQTEGVIDRRKRSISISQEVLEEMADS